jgi:hypothetical protein
VERCTDCAAANSCPQPPPPPLRRLRDRPTCADSNQERVRVLCCVLGRLGGWRHWGEGSARGLTVLEPPPGCLPRRPSQRDARADLKTVHPRVAKSPSSCEGAGRRPRPAPEETRTPQQALRRPPTPKLPPRRARSHHLPAMATPRGRRRLSAASTSRPQLQQQQRRAAAVHTSRCLHRMRRVVRAATATATSAWTAERRTACP